MLIAINGAVIDTRNIYKITELNHKNWKKFFEYHVSKKIYFNVTFAFTIITLNGLEHKVIIETKYIPTGVSNHEERYEAMLKEIAEAEERILKGRDKIITLWNQDSSPIPQINIE